MKQINREKGFFQKLGFQIRIQEGHHHIRTVHTYKLFTPEEAMLSSIYIAKKLLSQMIGSAGDDLLWSRPQNPLATADISKWLFNP